MKRSVFIVVVVLLLIPVIGCSSGSNSGLSDEVVDMMKMTSPDINMFSFMDIVAIRADDDLEDLYDDMEIKLMIPFGMCLCEVNNIAFVNEAYLSEGVIDLDETRSQLEFFSFEQGEYEGIEVWEKEDSCIALISTSFAISGNKDDVQYCINCIRMIEDGDDSLYDDSDIRDIVGRLPNGIAVGFVKERFIEDYTYEGLEVSGFSAKKKDEDTVIYTFVLKFEDGKDAEDAMQDIEDNLGDSEDNYRNIQVTQNGEYVEVNSERDMEDFIGGG